VSKRSAYHEGYSEFLLAAMDADDDLNALLAGDGDDIDSILKDAGLMSGSDEIDLDALLADIDAEDNGTRIAPVADRAEAAAPAALNTSGVADLVQARGVLSHALAAAAAPEGASDETSVAASVGKQRERKPSDMDEDDMLQVRFFLLRSANVTISAHVTNCALLNPIIGTFCVPIPCHPLLQPPPSPPPPPRRFSTKATTTTARPYQPAPRTLSSTSAKCWRMTRV
jgi:hypothetical protein